jgi:hypothetical protein
LLDAFAKSLSPIHVHIASLAAHHVFPRVFEISRFVTLVQNASTYGTYHVDSTFWRDEFPSKLRDPAHFVNLSPTRLPSATNGIIFRGSKKGDCKMATTAISNGLNHPSEAEAEADTLSAAAVYH